LRHLKSGREKPFHNASVENRVIEFTTDKAYVRRAREQRMLEAMMALYCQQHHFARTMCTECAELAAYSQRRLERCVFGDAKPTCAKCVVHCYKPEMRERIRAMMRWSGPRMMLRHPVLALRHVLDGRRPAPLLPGRKVDSAAE
jgi:hypothetical protein